MILLMNEQKSENSRQLDMMKLMKLEHIFNLADELIFTKIGKPLDDLYKGGF